MLKKTEILPDDLKTVFVFLVVILLIFLIQVPTTAQGKELPIKEDLSVNFFIAAKKNDVNALKQLLAHKIPLESRDNRGRTALLIATHNNAIQAARFLINAGADVNAKDDIQDIPYLYAGAEGKLEILKMTVTAGADLDSVNRYGGTALTPAAHYGRIETVRYLLTTAININQINKLGWTALLEAVILGNGGIPHQQIVKLLLDADANTQIADKDGITPLQHAINSNQSEIIKLFKQKN